MAHALVAGAIAQRFPSPVTSSLLAFTSHFIMDAVPHWDIGTNWRNRPKKQTAIFAVLETVLGITVAYALFRGKAPEMTLVPAIIASLLPDWLETPWYIFFAHQAKKRPGESAGVWERLAYRIYRTENVFHAKTQLPEGLLTQVITVIFFLVLLR